jgi:hypothetical protein
MKGNSYFRLIHGNLVIIFLVAGRGGGGAPSWGWGVLNFDMNKWILTYTKSILPKKRSQGWQDSSKKKKTLIPARSLKTILRAQSKKPPTLSMFTFFYNCFVVKVVIIH